MGWGCRPAGRTPPAASVSQYRFGAPCPGKTKRTSRAARPEKTQQLTLPKDAECFRRILYDARHTSRRIGGLPERVQQPSAVQPGVQEIQGDAPLGVARALAG